MEIQTDSENNVLDNNSQQSKMSIEEDIQKDQSESESGSKNENNEKIKKPKNIAEFDPLKNPPKLVLVQGPPKSGKTTLIRSLIKHYTKINIKDPKGPITIRTSKKQRITLLECPNDISAMCDLAKVPDIVLSTIDASLGFEMQTFEFLSILQIHGFPRLLGVITHLDYYKENKRKKKIKTQLKKRFEVEVAEESKLFYISDIKNGFYAFRDIHNLARLISVINPRELEFKKQHPHIVVDRYEILTSKPSFKDQDKIDVSFFGYLRGSDINTSKELYLTGLGFLNNSKIKESTDPCPPIIYKKNQRKILTREKLIYAPQSNLGLYMFDDSGDYVNIPDKHIVFTQQQNEDEQIGEHQGVQMMRKLHNPDNFIDTQIQNQKTLLIDNVELQTQDIKKDLLQKQKKQFQIVSKLAENVMQDDLKFQKNKKAVNLNDLIYNTNNESEKENMIFDCSKFYSKEFQNKAFYIEKIKHKFVTGGFESCSDSNEDEEEYEEMFEDNQKEEEEKLKNLQDRIEKGKYIKIELKGLKFGTYKQFHTKTLILSQIDYGEKTRGFLLVKFKRHRWYNALLKSNDPLIFSIGLQKFQSLPYYCKKDKDDNFRFLKYTPKFDFCFAVLFGTFVQPKTGVIVFQTINEDEKKFRVSGTGIVMGFSQNYRIKKKLKLIGEPFKIFKNTAFIKNMFNSILEVSKFTGAKIKTVSGIRGQIKKYSKEGPEGSFRATFEDKIILSDLIILRTWYSIQLDRVYNPIVEFDDYKLLKTTWQLRKQLGIQNFDAQNTYKKFIERPNKKFMPLLINKNLKKNLPFKTKDKINVLNEKKEIEKNENFVIKKIVDKKEKEAKYLIHRLKAIQKQKIQTKKQKDQIKREWKKKWKAGMDRKKNYFKKQREKKIQKKKYIKKNMEKQLIY